MMPILEHGIDIMNLNEPTAIILVGILGLLLYGAAKWRNPAAGAAWGISLMFLVLGSLIDLHEQLFWVSIFGTIVILIAGLLVRWAA